MYLYIAKKRNPIDYSRTSFGIAVCCDALAIPIMGKVWVCQTLTLLVIDECTMKGGVDESNVFLVTSFQWPLY
jgi:hypothetical protein